MCLKIEFFPQYKEKIYVIDGSNILGIDHNHKFILNNLIMVRNELLAKGVKEENILIVCDASTRHIIDKPHEYNNMVRDKSIYESPAGIQSDQVILQYCLEHDNALLLTNDLLRDFYDELPDKKWIANKRVAVMKINEEIYFLPMKKENFKIDTHNNCLHKNHDNSNQIIN